MFDSPIPHTPKITLERNLYKRDKESQKCLADSHHLDISPALHSNQSRIILNRCPCSGALSRTLSPVLCSPCSIMLLPPALTTCNVFTCLLEDLVLYKQCFLECWKHTFKEVDKVKKNLFKRGIDKYHFRLLYQSKFIWQCSEEIIHGWYQAYLNLMDLPEAYGISFYSSFQPFYHSFITPLTSEASQTIASLLLWTVSNPSSVLLPEWPL